MHKIEGYQPALQLFNEEIWQKVYINEFFNILRAFQHIGVACPGPENKT